MRSFSIVLFLGFLLIGNNVSAQKRLLMTRGMYQEWNSNAQTWTGWPDEYSYYDEGKAPILEFKMLDNNGTEFTVSVETPDKTEFNVTYKGYREDQDAHVYKDVNGDEIWIIGSTMSRLSRNGWPDNTVQIYFWIYSESYALLLE